MNKIYFLLITCLIAVSASAQTLTIDSCRAMALQHNKDRQQAALSTEAAIYTMRSTKALFFPNISFVGAAGYLTDNGSLGVEGGMLPVGALGATGFAPNGQYAYFPGLDMKVKARDMYTASLMLKQPIYMGGKIRAGYRKSQLAVDLYRQLERRSEAEVIQQVDEAYAKVVKARELEQVAQSYLTLLEELDKNVESAIRHGMRMEADRMKVQVRISEVKLQIRRAQNGVRLATMNLCHAIGSPLDTPLQVTADYPAIDDAQALATMNVQSRPEYQALAYQTQLAEQDVKMARAEHLPQVALLAKYGYTYGIQVNNHALLDGFGFAGGVVVNVPIYHFGEYANKIKAAKVKRKQAELELESKAELMTLELTQAANNLDEARLEVSLAEQSQESAHATMLICRKQFDAGVEPLAGYLEAQATWQKAYEAQVDAHFQLYLASVNYLRTTGQLVK